MKMKKTAGCAFSTPAVFCKKAWNIASKLCADLVDLLFPQRCVLCGRRLSKVERELCSACFSQLPFTGIRGERGNGIERIFWCRVPIERASSFIRHLPGSESRKVVHGLKYRKRLELGIVMGRCMAKDLEGTDFFEGVDLIVPVPLSVKRRAARGYNQSDMLAKGVSEVTGIRVDTMAVERIKDNVSQTRLSRVERRENVRGIFRLCGKERLVGRHVLLIDDVLTSGATLLSCAEEVAKAEGVKISVLTLAVAGTHPCGADLHLS